MSYTMQTRSRSVAPVSTDPMLSGLQRRLANMGENIKLELSSCNECNWHNKLSRNTRVIETDNFSVESTRSSTRLANKPRVNYAAFMEDEEVDQPSWKESKETSSVSEPQRRSNRIAAKPQIDYSEWLEFHEEEPVYATIRATKKPTYEVNIDFDEASQAWMANKKKCGMGMYKYKRGKF